MYMLVCGESSGMKDTIRMILSGGEIVSNEIQLLPDGVVCSKKGEFIADAQARKEIIEQYNAEKNDAVVDYEHQTLKDVEAPASGWIKELIDKGKDGLWAKVEWTPKAQEYISNKEYRYLSPVILVRKSDKRAVVLHSAALTNKPAIDGMIPLINKDEEDSQGMDLLKQLIAILGLPETATEQDVMEKVKACMNGDNVALKSALKGLNLKDNATALEVEASINSLKSPTGFVPMATYTVMANKVTDLEGKLSVQKTKDSNDKVELALKEGKLTPALRSWAEEYALKDPEAFDNFVKNAPKIVDFGKVKDAEQKQKTTLDEHQISVNKMLGISDADVKKYGGVEDAE